jgi:hypothetical protein
MKGISKSSLRILLYHFTAAATKNNFLLVVNPLNSSNYLRLKTSDDLYFESNWPTFRCKFVC